MDQFYLQNKAVYRKLVARNASAQTGTLFNGYTAAPQDNRKEAHPPTKEQDSSSIVIGARIRPMLPEDLAAGFPTAAYPRPATSVDGPDIVDLHDLYNHPRGRPILRVRAHF